MRSRNPKTSYATPFVLEFTGLPELPTWNEKTLVRIKEKGLKISRIKI